MPTKARCKDPNTTPPREGVSIIDEPPHKVNTKEYNMTMMNNVQTNFYRRGIRELAAQCADTDLLDLVYKLLAESAGSTQQQHTAQTELSQRVEDLDEWQSRLVLAFVNNLFGMGPHDSTKNAGGRL